LRKEYTFTEVEKRVDATRYVAQVSTMIDGKVQYNAGWSDKAVADKFDVPVSRLKIWRKTKYGPLYVAPNHNPTFGGKPMKNVTTLVLQAKLNKLKEVVDKLDIKVRNLESCYFNLTQQTATYHPPGGYVIGGAAASEIGASGYLVNGDVP